MEIPPYIFLFNYFLQRIYYIITQSELNVISIAHEAIRDFQNNKLELAIRKLELAKKLIHHHARGCGVELIQKGNK